MKCKQAQYVVSELIDGDVSPSSREQLMQHIRVCTRCRCLYQKLFALESLLDETFEPFQTPRIPDDFNQGVMERIAERGKPAPLPPRRAVRLVYAGIAAGIAVIVASLIVWRGEIQRTRSALSRPIEVASKPEAVPRVKEPAHQIIVGRNIAGVVWQVVGSLQASDPYGLERGGHGSVRRAGGPHPAQWSPVPRGVPLGPGARLRTGKRSRVKLGLADGTVIKVNADTTLAFASDRIRLQRGEIWAKVAKSKIPLLLETPRGIVRVLGTELNLKALERRDILSVLEGRVILHTPRLEVPCQSGEQLIISPEEDPHLSRINDRKAIVAWADFAEAERLYAAARFQQAKQAYRDLVRVHPENLTAQRRLFDTLERTAEMNIELVSGDNGAGSELESQRGLFRYTLRSQALKDLEASLTAVGHVVKTEPNNAKAQALLGYLLIAHGENDKALNHLKAATRIEPHPAEAHFSLAYLALNAGEKEAATRQIEEGQRRDPNSALGHTLRGITLCIRGRHAEALQEFEQALQADPHDAIRHANVAGMYSRMGEADKSLREYGMAADLTPASRYCVQELVEMHLRLGQAPQAVEHLKDLRAKAPGNDMVYIGLGRVYRELGEDLLAKAAFQEARRLNDKAPEPYLYLTDLYLKGGYYIAAARTILEGRRKFPDNKALLQQAQRTLEELPSDFRAPVRANLTALVRPPRDEPLPQLLDRLKEGSVAADQSRMAEEGLEALNDGKVRKAMDIACDLCQRLKSGSWVTFGAQPEGNGLRQIVSHPEVINDGLTREENIAGYECVRTDAKTGKFYIYFHLERSSHERLRKGAYILIGYYDSQPGVIRIEYDSTEAQGQYKRTSPLLKFGTRTWRYFVWFLKDTRFAGRQNGGADFRIATEEGQDTYLRWVCVLPAAELR